MNREQPDSLMEDHGEQGAEMQSVNTGQQLQQRLGVGAAMLPINRRGGGYAAQLEKDKGDIQSQRQEQGFGDVGSAMPKPKESVPAAKLPIRSVNEQSGGVKQVINFNCIHLWVLFLICEYGTKRVYCYKHPMYDHECKSNIFLFVFFNERNRFIA